MQIMLDNQTIDEIAINLIRVYEPPDGYYLGFSGGKDSVVTYDLTMRAGVRFDSHYNVSPVDPPEIRDFIKSRYPEVQWDYHARGFFGDKMMSEGLPMRPPVGHRWCCKFIKEAGGRGRVKLLGMRRAESLRRKGYECLRQVQHQEAWWVMPILTWRTADVWQYINERNLPVCSLYHEGFARLGCVLCPFLTKGQTSYQIKRFPKIALLWRLAANRYFDKRLERGTPLPFATKDVFWAWWIERSSVAQEIGRMI